MKQILENAIACKNAISHSDNAIKNAVILAAAKNIEDSIHNILAANKKDVESAKNLSMALQDRLFIDEGRIHSIIKSLKEMVQFPDPIGNILESYKRPNGLEIRKISIPIGVIGMIYESRPNVTSDAAAICIKSGNVALLKAGSESFHSSNILSYCFRDALISHNLPADIIQLAPSGREAVEEMLVADDYLDLIIPRGGKGLCSLVKEKSRVPVLLHLDGNCHSYINSQADFEMARKIILNAKMRRTGICGATESLLIDEEIAPAILPLIVSDLIAVGCEIRGCDKSMAIDHRIIKASEEDWSAEYLAAIISVKIVANIDDAIEHINKHSSHHTEAIITNSTQAAELFLERIDSAIVVHNASTQFADAGEFGMGAEIGISTGRLHARGPVGINQLTTYKYLLYGNGQTRPT